MSWYFNIAKFELEVNTEHLIKYNIIHRKTLHEWRKTNFLPSLRTLAKIDNNIPEDVLDYVEFNDLNTTGARIEQLRVQAFMNRGELAEELDVSTSTLRKWEQNQSKPNSKNIENMIGLFGVSERYLLEGAS